MKWTNEVWDKERRLTETKSTARRSGRGGGAAGVGDGGEGEGRPVRGEAEQANRTSHSQIYEAQFHLFSKPSLNPLAAQLGENKPSWAAGWPRQGFSGGFVSPPRRRRRLRGSVTRSRRRRFLRASCLLDPREVLALCLFDPP